MGVRSHEWHRTSVRSADPVVRHAVTDDAVALARLQVSSWQAAYAGIIPAGHLAAMSAAERAARHSARLSAAEPRGAELVAERDGTVVGWASCGPVRDDDLDPATIGEIRAMYADPVAWSTGVGAALMRASLDHLRGAGFSAVTLWVLEDNARARRFYEQWGFRVDGAHQVAELGTPVREVRYALELPAGG